MSGYAIQWTIIGAYLAFIFIKGVSKSRSVGNSDDFLLAGRDVPWWLLATTMGATVIGGGYSVGAIGQAFETGLAWAIIATGGYFHFIFSGLVVAPHFREARLYTVAGYFGHRYDERTRFAVMCLSVVFSVFIVAAQIAAIGSVLATLLPQDSELTRWAIVVGGLIVIIYSTAGGLLAVIYTDVYQFWVLILGFVVTVALILPHAFQNWSTISATLPEGYMSLPGEHGWIYLVTTWFAFLLGETFAPGYATRYMAGRSIRDTKIGIAGIGLVLGLTFPIVILFIAIYARTHFPGIDSQQALPAVVKELNNPVFASVMIAALLSAVMSSADSALNSATAIFTKDLFEHQLGWGHKGDRQILRIARYCTIALGLTSTLVAWWKPNIIDLLLFTYHIWAPSIFLPVVVGVLSKRRGPALNRAIYHTILISLVATLIYRITAYSRSLDSAVFGVGISFVAYGILSTAYGVYRD